MAIVIRQYAYIVNETFRIVRKDAVGPRGGKREERVRIPKWEVWYGILNPVTEEEKFGDLDTFICGGFSDKESADAVAAFLNLARSLKEVTHGKQA